MVRSAAGTNRSTSQTATSPTVSIPTPMTSTFRPRIGASRLLWDAPMMLPTANGMDTKPDSSAVCPRPDCQRIEIEKKMLVNAAK